MPVMTTITSGTKILSLRMHSREMTFRCRTLPTRIDCISLMI